MSRAPIGWVPAVCSRRATFLAWRRLSFFERAEGGPYKPAGDALSPTYIDDFVSSADGLRLAKAFTRIPRVAMRRRIVALVNEITDGDSRAAS